MFQLRSAINLLLIPVLALGLISCETTSSPPTHYQPAPSSVSIDKAQFDCGPRPTNWPDKATVQAWTTADAVDLANQYWFWGERCDKALQYNQAYFECYVGADLSACADLEALKPKQDTKNGTNK